MKYELPKLNYEYNALEPYMSAQVLTLHHTKHHQAYVNAANDLLAKLEDARKNNTEPDFKGILKALSFNVAGHILHSIFWEIMAQADSGKNKPSGKILEAIEKDFGSFERFKMEFSKTAVAVEGSGWATLVHDKTLDKLLVMQIEKHNVNLAPEQNILLCLDVWEHSYYLDYKNDRAKFVESWWNVVNWQEVEKRFSK